jgi:hypothetical protein
MTNAPASKSYHVKGICWAIDGDVQGPAYLQVEDESGKSVFWWLSYALLHSNQIANFHRLLVDVESGRIRFGKDDAKLWSTWRNAGLPEGHGNA